MQTIRFSVLAGLTLGLIAFRAEAQSSAPYKLPEMNFDMWCQEERHIAPERCDKRLPADDADYQAYVAKIQSYDIEYQQKRDKESTFNRTVLHNDPVDHPVEPSAPPTNQPPPGTAGH